MGNTFVAPTASAEAQVDEVDDEAKHASPKVTKRKPIEHAATGFSPPRQKAAQEGDTQAAGAHGMRGGDDNDARAGPPKDVPGYVTAELSGRFKGDEVGVTAEV